MKLILALREQRPTRPGPVFETLAWIVGWGLVLGGVGLGRAALRMAWFGF